jgi:RHS repeat-associated protein
MKWLCTLVLWGFAACASASSGITYYHTDVIGSPVMTTDEHGVVKWRASYSPFGSVLRSTESYIASLGNPVWFTGHIQDPQTSLIYMQGRYYNPLFGRFMSVDPAGFDSANRSSFSRYAYANNNPYRYIDPNGEEALNVNLFLVGVTIGNDVKSGQPFYKYRFGFVGVGVDYDPKESFSHADIGVGKYEGFNRKAISRGVKGRIGVSLGAGPFSVDANIVETQHVTVEIVDNEGASTYSIAAGSRYLTLGDGELSSAGVYGDKNVGESSDKVGLQFRADLFYEFGETF